MSPGSEGAELQSLPHGKPSQEDPGSCAVLQHHPLERKDGTGCAASEEPLPRLRSLLTSSSTRVPSCSTWIQETDAKRGCHCSKRCPGSIQTHLALPGAWAVIPAAIEEPPFPKGKGPKFTLRGCLGTDTARPCQGRTPY